eukprot:CAMPEP_0185756560 /NCGR_PEP_ID=MMETSP1174-20130828/14983_1 /TAXON_ID=35687 /ORGANISM="Dictyocha speculum, Strain CCMP1381" /LENGTH=526 /DNA_ID=CAMNT_0028435567 /DNA_START=44 /DNA_END=1624 /DNA_ORIENTATION=+
MALSMNQESPSIIYEPGVKIDALDTVQKWCEAEILEVDNTNRRILVSYTYWADKWNEWFDFHSTRIAPFASETYQIPGGVLKHGQRIEVLDTTNKWIEAEVIDTSLDQVKIHYKGWHAKFDEYIPRTSPRIRPYGRHKNLSKRRPPHISRQTSLDKGTEPQDRVRRMTSTCHQYERYLQALDRQGLHVQPVEGDGNCLFRSVSHQVYGDDAHHMIVRRLCMDYMESEKAYFEPYVVGNMTDFMAYLDMKRQGAVWGDDPEVQALCELYNRPAEIWGFDASTGARKLRTFHEAGSGARPPMRLSYYGGGHYDSIVGDDHPHHTLKHAPGVEERRRIEWSQSRCASLEETKNQSDLIATEQEQLEAALCVSRGEFDRQANDLECAFSDIFTEQVRLVTAQTDLERTNEELMNTITERSAMEHSTEQAYDNDLQAALSLSTSNDSELQQALLMSQQQGDGMIGGGDVIGGAAADNLGLQAEDTDMQRILAMSAIETDPELELALSMSKQQHSDEDEEMKIALQMSKSIW